MLLLGLVAQTTAYAFTLNVVDEAGNAVTGFKWTLEEDVSYRQQPLGTWVNPGQPGEENVQGFNFYKSYMPVVSSGTSTGSSATINVPDTSKHYFVSVIDGDLSHGMSGRPVKPNQSSVTVVLQSTPFPTAQIFVIAFHDNNPINNVLDQPQETGLGGFTVRIDDTVDQVKQDVYGNMLGTVYQRDAAGNAVLDVDGNPIVQCPGNGVILTVTQADVDAATAGNTCRNPYNLAVGEALIKNVHPGKYGVQVIPPTGSAWQQTSSIEGTHTNDAWVKANEPRYFAEFGAGVWHGVFGFVQPFNTMGSSGNPGSISGRIVNMHASRPPEQTFWPGEPFENCWIGLNQSGAGGAPGPGVYAARCGEEGNFSITGVPPGTYELVIFDTELLQIWSFHTVVVPPSGAVALGDVPVFRWFATMENYVFNDDDESGKRTRLDGTLKPGIPEQAVNIRFRDGSIHMSAPTDGDGFVPFEEVFPFFFWQVVEVDFLRYKATGLTVTVDAGGQVNTGDPATNPYFGKLVPQIQNADDPANVYGDTLTRTETGPVLTQGFQQFISTTNILEWGKKPYGPGENGGISGIVHYATTRAENDPRMTGAEDWEPGIPRVQVCLYQDAGNGAIQDVNGSGAVELCDVDNYPFGWSEGGLMGPEDFKRNGPDAGTNSQQLVFNAGDAISIATTDSWDDNLPSGCPAGNGTNAASDPFYQNGKCYDGLRNYNQVRPGVFDGGYAFGSMFPKGWVFVPEGGTAPVGNQETANLPAGSYVVEAVTPPGYIHQKEEDKNVDFGVAYKPSALMLPPPCVGDMHTVPAELTLFPGVGAPFADQPRPLCDRKQVLLAERMNGAADFFMFTEAPVAGHIQGFVLNDLANEVDVNAINFGEKQAMPFLPVSIKDWTGREVNRVYTDQYGNYNGLVPGTITGDRPSPMGISQSMHQLCVNDPGPIPDPAHPGQTMIDPQFNRQYTQFCYTLHFLSGRVTFADTPVLPVAAFASTGLVPVDSSFPDKTPMIFSVDNISANFQGPTVSSGSANRTLTIVSMGNVEVPNPEFGIEGSQPKLITRDYGFGNVPGTVRLTRDATTFNLVPGAWNNGTVSVTLPTGTTGVGNGEWQLTVIRGDNGVATPVGITVHVGNQNGNRAIVNVPPGGSIQTAIDSAPVNGLVMIPPGTYNEMVIMHKPVRLQGWGAGSTVINGTLAPTERIQQWRQRMSTYINSANGVILLTGQADPLVDVEGFLGSEGAPIFVAPRSGNQSFSTGRQARIDGLTIMGSNGSGGVAVNGNADFLTVSNNRILNNQGIYGGGVRLGIPLEPNASNDNVTIHHNQICENGTLQTPGGGIAIYGGAASYRITDNWVCANFAQGDGAGIAHVGLSPGGRIANNKILFNQTFEQTAGAGGAGGGILIEGTAPAAGALSEGSGSVVIEANLIQGNQAGTGDGGGIATNFVNGTDVQSFQMSPSRWYRIDIVDNMIVNNVTGLAGGGIALHDTLRANLFHNTIAHNDSTATAGPAFLASPSCTATANRSCPQPAGVVSRANSAPLQAVIAAAGATGPEYSAFSNPSFYNNIVWQNRSFYYDQTPSGGTLPGTQVIGQLLPDPANPVYADLAVLDTAGSLDPRHSVLTSTAGYDGTNVAGDPQFVMAYFNGSRATTLANVGFTTGIDVRPALDEGGNFIDVRFGPLSLTGNYHLQGHGSPAAELGDPTIVTNNSALLAFDYDGDSRPICGLPDAGADEITGACPAGTASAQNATTSANQSISIGVAALTLSAHSAGGASANGSAAAVHTPTPAGGTIAINPDRKSITYTPATNWTGTDTVIAVVSDGSSYHASTTQVVVKPSQAAASDPAAAGSVSVPSTPTSAPASSAPGASAATSAPADTSVTYAAGASLPMAGVALPSTSADEMQVAKAAPSDREPVEPVANLPEAVDHELVLRQYDAELKAYVFRGTDILDSASGAEGRKLSTVLVSNVKEGYVKLHADGTFEYAPPKSGMPKGPMQFTYRVSDGKRQSEIATITFSVKLPKDLKGEKAGTNPAKPESSGKAPPVRPGAPAQGAQAPAAGPMASANEHSEQVSTVKP